MNPKETSIRPLAFAFLEAIVLVALVSVFSMDPGRP